MRDHRQRLCGRARRPHCLTTAVGLLVLLVAQLPCHLWGAEEEKALPEFSTVRDLVIRELVHPPERAAGDIIAQTEVKPIFDHLRLMGWTVRDQKAILSQVLGDRDFVLQKSRTDDGRKFMRRISKYPLAYDRLYRLAALPGGRQLIVDLIRGKGGYRFVEYLATSRGGNNLGKMLASAPKGANFNQPTGKVFTAEQLIARLKQSHAAAQQRREDARQTSSAVELGHSAARP